MKRIEDDGPCWVGRLLHPDTGEVDTAIAAFTGSLWQVRIFSEEEMQEMRDESRENPEGFEDFDEEE